MPHPTSQPRSPLPLTFTLLPTNRSPSSSPRLTPFLRCVLDDIVIYRTLDPELEEPYISASLLLLSQGLPPMLALSKYGCRLPLGYDITLSSLAPFPDIWIPLLSARKIASSLGLLDILGESSSGMGGGPLAGLLNWRTRRMASWFEGVDEEQSGVVAHNWKLPSSVIPPNVYSHSSLVSISFPGSTPLSLPSHQTLRTLISPADLAALLSPSFSLYPSHHPIPSPLAPLWSALLHLTSETYEDVLESKSFEELSASSEPPSSPFTSISPPPDYAPLILSILSTFQATRPPSSSVLFTSSTNEGGRFDQLSVGSEDVRAVFGERGRRRKISLAAGGGGVAAEEAIRRKLWVVAVEGLGRLVVGFLRDEMRKEGRRIDASDERYVDRPFSVLNLHQDVSIGRKRLSSDGLAILSDRYERRTSAGLSAFSPPISPAPSPPSPVLTSLIPSPVTRRDRPSTSPNTFIAPLPRSQASPSPISHIDTSIHACSTASSSPFSASLSPSPHAPTSLAQISQQLNHLTSLTTSLQAELATRPVPSNVSSPLGGDKSPLSNQFSPPSSPPLTSHAERSPPPPPLASSIASDELLWYSLALNALLISALLLYARFA